MPQLTTLKNRPEFLRLRKSRSVRVPMFIMQGAARELNSQHPMVPRIGFIITKKIGNAVVRNRIRRRLKAALNSLANSDKQLLQNMWDYVVIPSATVLNVPFCELTLALEQALHRLRS